MQGSKYNGLYITNSHFESGTISDSGVTINGSPLATKKDIRCGMDTRNYVHLVPWSASYAGKTFYMPDDGTIIITLDSYPNRCALRLMLDDFEIGIWLHDARNDVGFRISASYPVKKGQKVYLDSEYAASDGWKAWRVDLKFIPYF